MRRLLLATAVVLAMLPASAAARGHGRGHWGRSPHVVIAPSVGFGYGWYDPFWGPFGYPYPYAPYSYPDSNSGKVKLETKAKNAEVYIDGSYAGTVGNLKSIRLKSGSYNIEVRSPDGRSYEQKVFVAPGKTVHLYPNWDQNDG